jgi:replication factor C subunit 1
VISEKLNIKAEVMDQLVQAAQSDIRLVINMLSSWSLEKRKSMNFDQGKELGAANIKPGMHTPFSLYSALSAPGLWAATSKKTLNDKTDYYFQDHSFMPLMVQQNYINQIPSSINQFQGAKREVKLMQMITKAAESISDGDVVDRMIHSSEQHWSLMPFHGIVSCVKPMSYAHGSSGTFPGFSR